MPSEISAPAARTALRVNDLSAGYRGRSGRAQR